MIAPCMQAFHFLLHSSFSCDSVAQSYFSHVDVLHDVTILRRPKGLGHRVVALLRILARWLQCCALLRIVARRLHRCWSMKFCELSHFSGSCGMHCFVLWCCAVVSLLWIFAFFFSRDSVAQCCFSNVSVSHSCFTHNFVSHLYVSHLFISLCSVSQLVKHF